MYTTDFFGKILVIDEEIMITGATLQVQLLIQLERDESHYHEMIAHVPLNYMPHVAIILSVFSDNVRPKRC